VGRFGTIGGAARPFAIGGSRAGARCRAPLPHGHGKTTTFTAGLRLDGIVASWLSDGEMDGEAFAVTENTDPHFEI